MQIIKFVKKWMLLCAMAFGACVYLLFAEVPLLQPVGMVVGPYFVEILPLLIFSILYVTFCKIRLHDLHFRAWFFWLQLVRIAMAGLLVIAIISASSHELKIILEGAFICVMCPTASAAAVITEKLGGSIASMTLYTLIDNGVTAIVIPLFFPLIEKQADFSFAMSFMVILERVAIVLVLPFCCAMVTRRWLPKIAGKIQSVKNLGFYMWGFNLAIVMGITLHDILTASISGLTMVMLLFVPLVVTFVLFAIGKSVGRRYDDSVCGGQALGQKNTIVGIWLALTYLNPLSSIAPCAYVVWQNMLNSWQLWCKETYGKLKW